MKHESQAIDELDKVIEELPAEEGLIEGEFAPEGVEAIPAVLPCKRRDGSTQGTLQ